MSIVQLSQISDLLTVPLSRACSSRPLVLVIYIHVIPSAALTTLVIIISVFGVVARLDW